MHALLIALLLTVLPCQRDQAEPPSVQDLVAACTPWLEADNYAFTLTTEDAGGREGRTRPAVLGTYVEDHPLRVVTGDIEAFVQDGHVAHRTGEEEWELFAQPAPGERRFGRRDRGDGPGRQGGFGGPGMTLNRLVWMEPPHVMLADLEGMIDDASQIKLEDVDGIVTFKMTLAEDAALQLGSPFGRGRPDRPDSSRGDSMDMEPEVSGILTVRLDHQGTVDRIVIDTTARMFFGDRERVLSRIRTISLTDVGTTVLNVPDEVTQLFAQHNKHDEDDDESSEQESES